MKIIETKRLILRTWKPEDTEAYYQINQDPKVIEFLSGSLTMEAVQNFIVLMNQQFEERNYTLLAAEEKLSVKLIGFIGLSHVNWDAPFSPCVEIGWRLGSEYWNKGYATEGAKAVLNYGFNTCHLKEIVAFTVHDNLRSINVMKKVGMTHNPKDDFEHPKLPKNHKLSKHVLYRIQK